VPHERALVLPRAAACNLGDQVMNWRFRVEEWRSKAVGAKLKSLCDAIKTISDSPSTIVLLTAIVGFALSSLFVLMSTNIPSSIMAGDEITYFLQAREFPTVGGHLSYYPQSSITSNFVYFWIGHTLWEWAVDPALSMRVIQSLMYGLTLPVSYLICRQFMPPAFSAVASLVTFVSARSSYSAYFMPETVYGLLFFILVLSAVLFASRPLLSAAFSGVLVALLLLTKPHGSALFFGVATTWFVLCLFPKFCGFTRASCVNALIAFALSTYCSMVLLNLLLTGTLRVGPLLFVGDLYVNAYRGGGRSIPPLWNFLTVTFGNAIPVILMVALPIIYTAEYVATTARRAWQAETTSTLAEQRLLFFALMSSCCFLCMFGMTVLFTAYIGGGELQRIHGRYYSFGIPLFIFLMFAVAHKARSGGFAPTPMVSRIGSLIFLAASAVTYFFWREYYTITPFDFPEIFALSTWAFAPSVPAVALWSVLIGVFAALAVLLVPQRLPAIFASYFLIFNVLSLSQTATWQIAHARSFAPFAQAAAAIAKIIPPSLIDRGYIVGPDAGELAYILFAMKSRSHASVTPAGSLLDRATLGPAVAWVLVDGKYDVRIEGSQVALRTEKLTLYNLSNSEIFGAPVQR
jgi:hypothetical protein